MKQGGVQMNNVKKGVLTALIVVLTGSLSSPAGAVDPDPCQELNTTTPSCSYEGVNPNPSAPPLSLKEIAILYERERLTSRQAVSKAFFTFVGWNPSNSDNKFREWVRDLDDRRSLEYVLEKMADHFKNVFKEENNLVQMHTPHTPPIILLDVAVLYYRDTATFTEKDVVDALYRIVLGRQVESAQQRNAYAEGLQRSGKINEFIRDFIRNANAEFSGVC